MPPKWPEKFTHEQLAHKAGQLHPGIAQPNDIGPVPHGDIRPPAGLGGTEQPLTPNAEIHPSGGPHLTGNPPVPGSVEMRWTPGGSFTDGRVASAGAGGNSPLASIAPEQIRPSTVVGRVDRYGENSSDFWQSGKGAKK